MDATEPTATRAFERGLREHRIRMHRCAGCGRVRHPARLTCPACLATSAEWEDLSGAGTVESFVWYFARPAGIPGFELDAPYNVAVVRLVGGPPLISNVIGVRFGDLAVNDPVMATFEDRPERTLLRFVAAAARSTS